MFDEFLNNGSILAILLMVYAGNVMMEALRRDRMDPYGVNTPAIIKKPISAIIMFGSVPCAFLPAVYIGFYSGWIAAISAWLALQVIGVIVAVVLGVRGPLLGFHFILASVAYPVGYFLSVSDMVA